MRSVHVEWGFAGAIYRREYPRFPVIIDDLQFSDANREADWYVAMQYVAKAGQTLAPRDRRILVVTEPNAHLPDAYSNQFGLLVSPFCPKGFDGTWYQSHGALPSFLGVQFFGKSWVASLDYAGLNSLSGAEKQDILSAVVSQKSVLRGHRDRLRFVRQLKQTLGMRFELYGRGVREIEDKTAAILPYRFHLVLENTVMPSYWTEKLADAWLGYAFPIVSGPPDLGRWFPPDSFLSIDIAKPGAAIEAIQKTMDEGVSADRFAAVCEARRRVLTNERLCPLIARVIAANPSTAPRLSAAETLTPPKGPSFPARLAREVGRVWWQLETRLRP